MLQRVGIIGGGHSGNDAGILHGICRYARPSRRWVLHDASRATDDLVALEHVMKFQPDGLISHATTAELVDALRATRLPVVNVSNVLPEPPFPTVSLDDVAIGRLGGEYLRSLGFQNFGYVGDPNTRYSENRLQGFRQAVADVAPEVRVFASGVGWLPQSGPRAEVYSRLQAWLDDLPKPVAILTAHDQPAMVLSEASHELELPVPEQVAILGIDNYELICRIAHPPLSSIRLPVHRIGYEAAMLLDTLMSGNPSPEPHELLPPLGIEVRQSTDIIATSDPVASKALRFIRDNACDGIDVNDVLRAVGTSRSTLCRTFRNLLGRSPLDEIHRVRCQAARQMLIDSDLSVSELAAACGYRDATHLGSHFRKRVGTTPGEFRKQFRLR
ncbi:MAG: substrate-binding domain-containing protein [Phycisphaerae bacterium]